MPTYQPATYICVNYVPLNKLLTTEYAYHEPKTVYEERLPGIVVMPINYKNALPILSSLKGEELVQL